jgi:hypothetical protein
MPSKVIFRPCCCFLSAQEFRRMLSHSQAAVKSDMRQIRAQILTLFCFSFKMRGPGQSLFFGKPDSPDILFTL